MANEQNTEIQDLTADELKDKANSLFEQYKNLIFGLIGAIILLIVGLYWYAQSSNEKNAEAQIELYKANIEFKRDSLQLALNGRNVIGQASGFIGYTGIIADYSGTEAANLAHYYAGISTLRLGQPQLAVNFLENFSGEELLQTQAYTLIGDAYSELKQMDKALASYEKAAGNTDNTALSLYAKWKAARLLEFQGNTDGAKKALQEIMDTDPEMAERLGVDKDLIRLS
ncbi:MAG: tetratricopeptide repeat protein [Aureispira sp.]